MKEYQMIKDQWGGADIRAMPVNSFIKLKLNKTNKCWEKELARKADGVKFKVYKIQCLHAGEEMFVAVTPAIAKRVKEYEVGDEITIYAIKSDLKGGKSYTIDKEEDSEESESLFDEPTVLTEKDIEAFDKIIGQLQKRGMALKDVDDAIIIKALSGHLGYTLDDAEDIAKLFPEYVKGKQ